MPPVTIVGKTDLALAGASSGTFARATAPGVVEFDPVDDSDVDGLPEALAAKADDDAVVKLAAPVGQDVTTTLALSPTTAILNLETGGTHQGPALDVRKQVVGGAYMMRYFTAASPGVEPVAYHSDNGGYYSVTEIICSGHKSGAGENFRIHPPTLDPLMIGIGMDVGYGLQIRNQNVARCMPLTIVHKDEATYLFGIDQDAKAWWGAGTTKDSDGLPIFDANLYRNAAGVLKTDTALTIGTTLTVGTLAGLLKGTAGVVAAAVAGTDYPGLATANTFTQTQTIPTVQGGAASGGNVTLNSTSHATKGNVFLNGTTAFIDTNGHLNISDGNAHLFLNGGKLQAYHDGSSAALQNSVGNLSITCTSASGVIAFATNNTNRLTVASTGEVTLTKKLTVPGRDGPITANTDAATVTFNAATSDRHTLTMETAGTNRTLAVTGDTDGQTLVLYLTQGASGSRTVTWWSGVRWVNGTAPTLATVAGHTDVIVITRTASGVYYGFVSGPNMY